MAAGLDTSVEAAGTSTCATGKQSASPFQGDRFAVLFEVAAYGVEGEAGSGWGEDGFDPA